MKIIRMLKSIKFISSLIILFFIIATWQLNKNNYLTTGNLLIFLQNHRISAPVFFVLIHTLLAAFFIPCSPLTIIAGILWGQQYGILFATLGALSASCFTFIVGRYLAADYIRRHLNKATVTWALRQADKYGWKAVAFTQMNPVFPSSTLGYLYGLTHISFKTYIVTTLLFMLPLQIAFVSVGQSTRNILFGDTENFLIPAIFMVISFFVFFMLKPLTQRLLGINRKKNDRS
ncbi:MAG: TVP38/TMEM64 family protein [Sulfuricaulis sp.]